MRLLCITNQFPLPVDMGGPVRFLGLLEALASRNDLHVLALRRANTTDGGVAELASLLEARVEAFGPPGPPGRGALPFARRWARSVARGMPPWILAEHDPALDSRARELAKGFDAVVILDDYAGAYAPSLAGLAPIVLDKSHVLGWSIARPPPTRGAWQERMRLPLDVALTRRFEGRSVRRADAVVVTSQDESARLARLYGRAADAVVPSAIDAPKEATRRPRGGQVGWLGAHDYRANVDGLVSFVESAWEPLGRDGYRLMIAGKNPPPRVRALERAEGVSVLGFVEDLGGFLEGLEAAVVPLWHGAGVKVKTLTFLGAGVPVAATPVAVEGIEVEHGRDCLVAEDPPGLSAALREILTDPELARRLGAQGHRLVSAEYTWETVGPAFLDAVEAVAGVPPRTSSS